MVFKKLTVAVAVLSVAALTAGSAAMADPAGGPRCTVGEAHANFEAPLQEIIGEFACQYRLFFDGDSRTFCEDDVILGGVNVLFDYKALGVSREEAIADLERYGERVWIDGVEQQVVHTAYKDGQHPAFGQVVYQHRAFIARLSVGDHVSHWQETLDGSPDASATVQLHILPRTDALCS
jgi:hypothetical protein